MTRKLVLLTAALILTAWASAQAFAMCSCSFCAHNLGTNRFCKDFSTGEVVECEVFILGC